MCVTLVVLYFPFFPHLLESIFKSSTKTSLLLCRGRGYWVEKWDSLRILPGSLFKVLLWYLKRVKTLGGLPIKKKSSQKWAFRLINSNNFFKRIELLACCCYFHVPLCNNKININTLYAGTNVELWALYGLKTWPKIGPKMVKNCLFHSRRPKRLISNGLIV